MTIGVGVDIVELRKIENMLRRHGKDFLQRIFNEDEITHLPHNKIYAQRIAARFAVKEAVIKALGKKNPLAFKDIYVSNLPTGAPVCHLPHKRFTGIEILISLSHVSEYAVAVAVAQRKIQEE